MEVRSGTPSMVSTPVPVLTPSVWTVPSDAWSLRTVGSFVWRTLETVRDGVTSSELFFQRPTSGVLAGMETDAPTPFDRGEFAPILDFAPSRLPLSEPELIVAPVPTPVVNAP